MMRQYCRIKKKYKNYLLFFRLGDFYELFFEDAKIGAELLNITLTSRSRGSDGKIPMAGVPYHSINTYVAKLVKLGQSVALCEQIGDTTKPGLTKREVTRIITPGTLIDENYLEKKENNYITSLKLKHKNIYLAYCDISTGDFYVKHKKLKHLKRDLNSELIKINPKECILSFKQYTDTKLIKLLKDLKSLKITLFEDFDIYAQEAESFIKDHFNIKSLESYGINNQEIAKTVAGLLGYLKTTQNGHITNLKKIIHKKENQTLQMDIATINNLEIIKNLKTGNKEESLINIIDKTNTAFGGRLFKSWILNPLVNKKQIEKRLSLVEYFIHKENLRRRIENILKDTRDVERIISRITLNTENPKDVILLKESLINIIKIYRLLKNTNNKQIQKINKKINKKQLEDLVKNIEKTLVEDPPADPKQGSLIKKGINSKLDNLKKQILGSQEWIVQLEEKEKNLTKIPSLKVRYNKVFGYYIEVSKSYSKKVPKQYLRKQTLVNAERYITPELKEHEEKILKAEEQINNIEYKIFKNLLEKIKEYVEYIQTSTKKIAKLDVLISFSNIAIENNYTKPKLNNRDKLEIIEGRHPVVERTIESPFIPNSIKMNSKENQFYILTGPNMAGKSVFARQIALIVILAQSGSYVPAKYANIGIVDKVFVRSGASDFISTGLSTFMVEMVETANILNNSTNKSLIILDEVGRGTGTKDGIAIAKAIAEYLIENPEGKNPKTLFATHYHELQKLEKEYPHKIKNIKMVVKENSNGVIFLHKVSRGAANHSYGIEVAKLAGIPNQVIKRANELLEKHNAPKIRVTKTKNNQMISKVLKELKKINIEKITPIQALNTLYKIKKIINAKD